MLSCKWKSKVPPNEKTCPTCGDTLKIYSDIDIVRSGRNESLILNTGEFTCPSCSVVLQLTDDNIFELTSDTSDDRAYPYGYNPCDNCDVPNNKHLPCLHRQCPCIDCENKGSGMSCNECSLIPKNNQGV